MLLTLSRHKSDEELLVPVLGKSKTKVLLEKYNDLHTIFEQDSYELLSNEGIGKVTLETLEDLKELTNRIVEEIPKDRQRVITAPEDIYDEWKHISDERTEKLGISFLDNSGKLIKNKMIYEGSETEISIHPRKIFNEAITTGASSIIMTHNHPSGDSTPSGADLESTKRLYEISKIIGIELIDHVIVTSNDYTSIRKDYPIVFSDSKMVSQTKIFDKGGR